MCSYIRKSVASIAQCVPIETSSSICRVIKSRNKRKLNERPSKPQMKIKKIFINFSHCTYPNRCLCECPCTQSQSTDQQEDSLNMKLLLSCIVFMVPRSRERAHNRNNRSHKFPCATAWRGIMIFCIRAIEVEVANRLGFEPLLFFGNRNPLFLSVFLPVRTKWNYGSRTKTTEFLKVIKFYDFFMCFCRCWGCRCSYTKRWFRPYSID